MGAETPLLLSRPNSMLPAIRLMNLGTAAAAAAAAAVATTMVRTEMDAAAKQQQQMLLIPAPLSLALPHTPAHAIIHTCTGSPTPPPSCPRHPHTLQLHFSLILACVTNCCPPGIPPPPTSHAAASHHMLPPPQLLLPSPW